LVLSVILEGILMSFLQQEHALAQAARAEVAAEEKAARNAEAKCTAAEQSLKEERSKEGSYYQYQQVRAACPCRAPLPTKGIRSCISPRISFHLSTVI